MLSGISWSVFFIYLGGALLVYYIFVIFLYYKEELSSLMKNGFSKKIQTDDMIETINVSQNNLAAASPLGGSRDYSYAFQDTPDARPSIIGVPERQNVHVYQNVAATSSEPDGLLEQEEAPGGEDIIQQPLNKEKLEKNPSALNEDFDEYTADELIKTIEEERHVSEKEPVSKKVKSSKTAQSKSKENNPFEDISADELINIFE